MQPSNNMTRTFWPATDFSDLPHAFAVESRLANWALQWFGDNARFETPRIVDAPDLTNCRCLARDREILVAVRIGDPYVSYVSSKVPLLLSREDVIAEHAAEFITDLCDSVFGIETSGVVFEPEDCPARVPSDALQVVIDTGLCGGAMLEVFVTADAYLGTPQPAALPDESMRRRTALAGTPVRIQVEKSFSMNVNDLFGLSVGDFVPVSKVDDVSFALTVAGAPIGVAYIGQIDNHLNVVVES